MAHAVLEAENVEKTFGGSVRALDGVSLRVESGQTVVLIGESGCGKSTLLRLFNRLVEPTAGTVRVGGRDAGSLDPISLRRGIGYVQQEGGLLPHWTIGRNVGLVPALLGWNEAKRRARVEELLALVGLEPSTYRDRHPRALSGGQRQRVAFARALAADPDVILLDEPFGALDALTRLELQAAFTRLRTQLDKTMLLVTHDLAEAFRLGTRVAVMRGGKILQNGTPEEIRTAPACDYVRDLVAHGLAGRVPPPPPNEPPA